jgi:serine protease Do/serine protease DegQ
VVKEATQVIVTLKDRRQFEAKLVGSDPGTDIAVLQIEAPNLAALRLGDSDDLEVGDFVVAIGNPFGLGQTVTSGIVSALGRSGLDIEGYEDFIQTDASINPGNSGGALVNLSGELVGINTAIIGPAGGNVGIGFAVPVNMARAVMDQILRFGEVRRGRLGVGTQDLTPELAESLAAGRGEGAVVINVEPGSAAEKAGIRTRDVVLAVNGKPVRSSADVRNKVGLVPVGERLELSLLRNGKPLTAKLVVEAPPEVTGGRGQQLREIPGALFGNIERGSPAYGKAEGVLVLAVQREGKAATWGLRPGDIVYAVNRRKVRSVSELAQALKNASGRMSLSLLRGDYRLTLIIG